MTPDPLQTLGQAVAREQDEALAEREDELHRVRARLLVKPKRKSSIWFPALMGLGFAAAATLGAVWLGSGGWSTEPSAAISYQVGTEDSSAQVGRWLSAEATPLALSFSDGSLVELGPASDGRVKALGPHGAAVELARGRASLRVQHRERTDWRLSAGPFLVHVVGTTFDVAWDPNDALFELTTREGQVRVSGPLLRDQDVRAGETVRVWLRDGRVETQRDQSPTPSAEVVTVEDEPEATATEPEQSARAVGTPERAPRRPSAGRSSPAPGFDELARDGHYSDAVAAAERAGWSVTLAQAPLPSLLRLADAARLSGRHDLAAEAYRAVRQRFPGSSAAARAAFMLGRVSYDQRRAPADAARWFTVYLEEAPSGPLAREAAGRLMEAHRSAGHEPSGRSSAARYLQRYPNGPHAALARSLLSSP